MIDSLPFGLASTPRSHPGFVGTCWVGLRRTTGLLVATLGDERLRTLRAEGERMDTDEVAAYTLNAAAHAAPINPPES